MNDVWLKIKVWTKTICFGLVAIYALLFVYNNSAEVTVWWWFKKTFASSTLVLIAIAFLAGAVSEILIRTTWRTLHQIRDLRDRNRTDRLEREMADMKAKAARLQTKPFASGGSVSTSATTTPPGQSID